MSLSVTPFLLVALFCTVPLLAEKDSQNCPSYQFLVPVALPSVSPSIITAALAAVNATLHSAIDPIYVPGFSASVWYRGVEVQTWSGGVADKSTGRRPDPNQDLYRIASTTKVYVALLAEVFADLGYMSMDDPVAKYCPSFHPINTFDDGQITFHQLASMTAGLPDSLLGYYDWRSNMTTADVFTALNEMPLMVPLSSLPLYSNLGIAVLGHILSEFVAPEGERGDLDALLRKYVLIPLGLDNGNTGYNITASVASRLCPAYDSGTGNRVPAAPEVLGWSAPCGQMWSTMPNLAQFYQSIAAVWGGSRSSGFALSPARAREWLNQPAYVFPDGSMIEGLPWESHVVNGVTVHTKAGDLDGYMTKSAVIPEIRLSFAFAYNGNLEPFSRGDVVIKEVAAQLTAAFIATLQNLQPKRNAGPSASDYFGVYVLAGQPSSVNATVKLDDVGQLVLISPLISPEPLTLEFVSPQTPDTFRAYGQPTSLPCESTMFLDATWASPMRFWRNSVNPLIVESLTVINVNGFWIKM